MTAGLKKLRFLVIIFFIGYFLVIITKGSINNRKVIARYNTLQEQYTAEIELNKQLKQRLQTINNDSFIELTARKRLGLVKPGEIVYKIVEE